MSNTIQAIRGMNDVLPDETPYWQRLEAVVRDVLGGYGYAEVRLPLVEKTELFSRSIGEVTDIVEKEMYTFADRNGDSLTLRPEGTAGCVRAAIQHALVRAPQRLWYTGPMFRHERPQKGRYRQFHQVGVEVFGLEGPDVDAEIILVNARIWRRLGLQDLTLELNSLGSPEARQAYRRRLVDYLQDRRGDLDEDSLRRLDTNPLRILDSKNPAMAEVVAAAPRLLDHLDAESADHFDRLRDLLTAGGVGWRLNPTLVRGLDYYTRTVFEWTTDRLGAQGTVSAGGRYDGLVAQLGGKGVPAVGFAMGLERLVALLQADGPIPDHHRPHVFLALVGDGAVREGLAWAERWRDGVAGLRLVMNCGGGGLKAQLKRADRSGAPVALILGEDELASGRAALKPLRGEGAQESVPLERVQAYLSEWVRAG